MVALKRKEDRFYELFSQSATLVCTSTKVLHELMENPNDLPERIQELQAIEHQADDVTTTIIDRLNQTLITPMDREDIFTLAQSLDDIIDFVLGSAERMLLFKTGQPMPAAAELARLLMLCADHISASFSLLRNLRGNRDKIIGLAAKIGQLESEGDKTYRKEVARLFEQEQNAITIIKWKDILEHLETALDFCEDVADLLKGVVLKHA